MSTFKYLVVKHIAIITQDAFWWDVLDYIILIKLHTPWGNKLYLCIKIVSKLILFLFNENCH